MSLEMFPTSECACDICQKMCHTPCTGTPEDIEAIIEAGYGDRLCLDDWPGEVAGATEELIQNGVNGFIIDPLDIGSFAECLLNVMMGKYNLKRMSASALGTIQSFSIEDVAKVIADTVTSSVNVGL